MMLSKFAWGCLFCFSMIGILVGLILPIFPHTPFLLLAIYCLHHLAPVWLEKQKVYRNVIHPFEEKIKHKLIAHKKS